MPPQPPTSFASAAASNGGSDGAPNSRGPGGSGDWSRSRTNGATTFRRTSQATALAQQSRETSHQPSVSSTSGSNVYVPPHLNSSYSTRAAANDHRFSKEQLLDMFKIAHAANESSGNVSSILTEGWAPGASTGGGMANWARREDPKDVNSGPDICWDQNGAVKPLGLIGMDEEEKELFLTSVNSPLKPPPQNPKEGAQTGGANGRKTSISQAQNPASGLQPGRPGARRRDTSDTVPVSNPLASPTAFDRGGRGDISTPPATLMRRRTGFEGGGGSAEKTKLDTNLDNSSPFGSFKRTTTNPLSAGVNGPSSPWAAAPQSAGFGAFGNFAIGATPDQPTTPGEKKLGFGSMRGESRFRGLMGKDSSEDIGGKAREKQGPSLLERLGETDQDVQSSGWGASPAGKDRHALGDQRVGSAALGGEDASPPQHSMLSMDQRRAQEDIGFSGLNRDPRLHETPQSVNRSTGQFDGSMSPTGTNPYQSPEAAMAMENTQDDEDDPSNLYGGRGDRSQTSSTNPNRGLGGLHGFGNIGPGGPGAGWSAGPGAIGSQSRVSSAFSPGGYQDSIFGSMNDVSSPFGNPGNAFGAIGRGSGKMSSLFPQPAQEQMRHDHGFPGFGPAAGAGLGGFGMPMRDTDSPSRSTRGPLDDLFPDTRPRGMPNVSSPFAGEGLQRPDSASQSLAQQAPGLGATSAGGSNPVAQAQDSNQMPAAQKRQMVMPDRMRWIYRDPSGQTQGPWSGLEMHDWYKAGFFSPELLVKKQEDDDYEPLAQLIRRIGNSREPFLVPQIGIPHGPATSQPGGAPIGHAPVGPQGGSAQPPFPSSFPSFGTTLTAQQQNDLERRKQEEQFLMARQKEQLAAHQAMMKNMQMSGMPHGPQGLNHHSSAQSLHSQPSYGSITSPSAFQHIPQPAALQQHPGNAAGFFDRSAAHAFGAFSGEGLQGRENDISSPFGGLNLGRSTQSPYSGGVGLQNQEFGHQQQVNSMLQDRARLQKEQEQGGELGQPNDLESQDRLDQFNQLRSQGPQASSPQGVIGSLYNQDQSEVQSAASVDDLVSDLQQENADRGSISALEQAVQAQQTIVPPAPSISPLPAPAAQRHRQQVVETLAADNRSRSQTPSVDTPSAALAPWAKDAHESAKGPSLKEIQEAEAKKAAQQEAVAAEARRQLAEQERIAAASVQAQAVAGLPSGANWATSASPTTAANAASAWAKKVAVATPTTGTKKTLAQIQKEEEARKNRQAAAAAAVATQNAATAAAAPVASGGKRYADLASKPSGPAPMAGGAWTTVGHSGKARTPVSPSVSTPQRTASGGVPVVAKPKAPVPSRTNTGVAGAPAAQEEFQKWAKNALSKGLNSSINVDDFVRNLLQLPAEPEMLSDAVYANSQTLDGRRFAEEFVRRRKQADKGVAPEPTASSNFNSGSAGASESKASGGWSEVAKKGPVTAQQEKSGETAAFKVVAAKKKGKR